MFLVCWDTAPTPLRKLDGLAGDSPVQEPEPQRHQLPAAKSCRELCPPTLPCLRGQRTAAGPLSSLSGEESPAGYLWSPAGAAYLQLNPYSFCVGFLWAEPAYRTLKCFLS